MTVDVLLSTCSSLSALSLPVPSLVFISLTVHVCLHVCVYMCVSVCRVRVCESIIMILFKFQNAQNENVH